MTKGMVEPAGWVYLVLVLDWYTRTLSATLRDSGPTRRTGDRAGPGGATPGPAREP